MKSKSITLGIAATFLTLSYCSAQKGAFEGRFDVGYGFSASPAARESSTSTSNTSVPYSLGQGLNLDLSGSYFFSDHLGAGLDLGYLIGSPTTITDDNGSDQSTETITGSLFSITPMLVLSANSAKINPYGRFGIAIGIPSAKDEYTEAGTNAPSGTFIYTYSGNMAIGWYAAFGIQFPIANNLMLDAELFDRTLAWAPGKQVNTQAFDGQSKYPTITYSKTADKNSTTQDIYTYSPFSSAGIKIGITMKF